MFEKKGDHNRIRNKSFDFNANLSKVLIQVYKSNAIELLIFGQKKKKTIQT